jgi:hypothetical protein
MIPAMYRVSPYPTEAPTGPDEPLIYECDLCTTTFESEDELSKHIVSQLNQLSLSVSGSSYYN